MNTGFLLAEDAAVKARFSGMTVSDDKNGARPVQVFFRYPEGETERIYPFITIESIDIVHALERQHSEVTIYASTSTAASAQITGPAAMTYWPSEHYDFTQYVSDSQLVASNEFLPVDILYQVSTYTRSAMHDRQLTSQMLHSRARMRWGFIDVPADNTVRRFDLLDWVTADLLDPEAGYRKRIFRKVYTLKMSAEMTTHDLVVSKRATQIHSSISDTNSNLSETVQN